ncbi:hypothetical protein HYC85_014272 [Camellia sinensis]|uniref:Dihydroorotase n=1 Tax=Camellia sinensis TaxID=4442 RepID=A0A7J7H717_CAMSI|nr:hypothetical protein HYC85_014272 [Camellia sinensis]
MIKVSYWKREAPTLPFANVRGLNQLKAEGAKMELSIMQPDDWHLRLRDGDLLEAVISHSAFHFGRGIVIPNLKPPFKTTAAVVAYQESILKTLPANSDFIPLMTLYLIDTTTPEEIKLARDSGVVYAVKLYPAGATTNSQYGVTDLFGKCLPVLEEMVKHNMPLLAGALDKPEAFTSFNGPNFYGLPRNTSKIKLIKSRWKNERANHYRRIGGSGLTSQSEVGVNLVQGTFAVIIQSKGLPLLLRVKTKLSA